MESELYTITCPKCKKKFQIWIEKRKGEEVKSCLICQHVFDINWDIIIKY